MNTEANTEFIGRFLMEFAHFEDGLSFAEESPQAAHKLATGIYHALLKDQWVSADFKAILQEKWSGILTTPTEV